MRRCLACTIPIAGFFAAVLGVLSFAEPATSQTTTPGGVRALYAAGRYDEVIGTATALLVTGGPEAGLLSMRAAAFYRLGRDDEALTDADGALRLERTALALAIRAGVHVHRMENDAAIEEASAAIAIDPTEWIARRVRLTAELRAERYNDATIDASALVKRFPNDTSLLYVSAFVKSATGDSRGAIADSTRGIALDPNDATLYDVRADAEYRLADYPAALADSAAARAIDPKDTVAIRTGMVIHMRQHDVKAQIADMTALLGVDPGDSYTRALRAGLHDQVGEYALAIEDATKALERQGDSHVPFIVTRMFALAERGTAYFYVGEYQRAIADETACLQINAGYPYAHRVRGAAYFFDGKYAQAVADETKAIAQDPSDAYAYRIRGSAHYFIASRNGPADEFRASISDATRSLALEKDGSTYARRGAAYLALNEYDRAIADESAALRLDPAMAFARRTLEQARLALGASDGAAPVKSSVERSKLARDEVKIEPKRVKPQPVPI